MGPTDLLVVNAHLATMVEGGEPYGAVRKGAVAVREGRIAYAGPEEGLPTESREGARELLDAEGRWVTPGLIDCHTHLVFGGTRVGEWERRLEGASYEELARAGGGILSTVEATHAATDDELRIGALGRLQDLLDGGVTTVEVKSGYGLDTETELRMLRVARSLEGSLPVTVRTTLLGAHALPDEYRGRREEYVDLVCREMIPAAAEQGLADAVDAFCEEIAFSADECRRVLAAGAEAGLALRLHADQRTDQGGARLAAEAGARSADHLEHTSEAGVRAMAEAGTAAVLLPGAAHFLGDETVPPVEAFRAHGVPMAVATDLNPGSSPLRCPLMAMNLACTLFGLTPEESLAGMTRHAAGVLGMAAERGTIATGKAADLVVWNVDHPAELAYWMGGRPREVVVKDGRRVV